MGGIPFFAGGGGGNSVEIGDVIDMDIKRTYIKYGRGTLEVIIEISFN